MIFLQPCDEMLFDSFKEKLVIVAGVAIGIGVVMVSRHTHLNKLYKHIQFIEYYL